RKPEPVLSKREALTVPLGTCSVAVEPGKKKKTKTKREDTTDSIMGYPKNPSVEGEDFVLDNINSNHATFRSSFGAKCRPRNVIANFGATQTERYRSIGLREATSTCGTKHSGKPKKRVKREVLIWELALRV
ncbi:hypothetical protein THAOC_35628, partial [Thalassiosira oceanica]